MYVTVPVPYTVMALGGDIHVPTVHGKDGQPGEEELHVKRGTESGHVVVMRGKGVEHDPAAGRSRRPTRETRGRGTARICRPEEEELLRQLAEVRGHGVQERGFWKNLIDRITG